jgi:hypothetical protein
MLVKVFNNLWRTSTAKVAILRIDFLTPEYLDFLSYKLFPGYGYVYITRTRKPESGYLNLSNMMLLAVLVALSFCFVEVLNNGGSL